MDSLARSRRGAIEKDVVGDLIVIAIGDGDRLLQPHGLGLACGDGEVEGVGRGAAVGGEVDGEIAGLDFAAYLAGALLSGDEPLGAWSGEGGVLE